MAEEKQKKENLKADGVIQCPTCGGYAPQKRGICLICASWDPEMWQKATEEVVEEATE